MPIFTTFRIRFPVWPSKVAGADACRRTSAIRVQHLVHVRRRHRRRRLRSWVIALRHARNAICSTARAFLGGVDLRRRWNIASRALRYAHRSVGGHLHPAGVSVSSVMRFFE